MKRKIKEGLTNEKTAAPSAPSSPMGLPMDSLFSSTDTLYMWAHRENNMVDWQCSASVFRDEICRCFFFVGKDFIFFTHENRLVAQMKTTPTGMAWAGKVYEQAIAHLSPDLSIFLVRVPWADIVFPLREGLI